MSWFGSPEDFAFGEIKKFFIQEGVGTRIVDDAMAAYNAFSREKDLQKKFRDNWINEFNGLVQLLRDSGDRKAACRNVASALQVAVSKINVELKQSEDLRREFAKIGFDVRSRISKELAERKKLQMDVSSLMRINRETTTFVSKHEKNPTRSDINELRQYINKLMLEISRNKKIA